jgi:hypothetical protein
VERRRLHVTGAVSCLLALGACGGGERQDADEPEGTFRVEVLDAEFPTDQRLAKRSELRIRVRNAGTEAIPNIAVTLDGLFERRRNRELADPSRPVFVINGVPKEIGTYAESKELAPEGGDTAYVSTWALGRLGAGRERTFKWSVTAVRPGAFRLGYRVSAGLDGKAKAVGANGRPTRGLFIGTVDGRAPDTRVAEDGRTVVEGLR